MTFNLHPQLENDSFFLKDLALCQLRLINDQQYPWFILVPKVTDIVDIHKLSQEQQHLLLQESNQLCCALENVFSPDKLNVAAIGNVVPQLHVHHVVRYKHDVCWPKPIWGQREMVHYEDWQNNTKIVDVMTLVD